jgi:hypothetical protein
VRKWNVILSRAVEGIERGSDAVRVGGVVHTVDAVPSPVYNVTHAY